MKPTLAALALAMLCAAAIPAQERPPSRDALRRSPAEALAKADDRLAPTTHPPLPAQRSQYWFVADAAFSPASARRDAAIARFARGVELIASGDFAAGLPLVSPRDLDTSVLGPYARYYTAVAQIGLARVDEADATLKPLVSSNLEGALKESATLLLADVAIKRGDAGRAEDLLEDLSDDKLSRPEDVLIALGRAEETLGHAEHALQAYRRVYYDYPLGPQAVDAQDGIARVETTSLVPADRFQREWAASPDLRHGA